jgi:FkbM family methyltransferase
MSRPDFLKPIRALKSWFVHLALRPVFFRRWLAWGLRCEHYDELGVVVPLSSRVVCPIPHEAAWSSFCEIFLQGEYDPVFARIAPPRRWLDLGCFAGFFTAYVMMRRDRAGLPQDFSALLADGDRRSGAAAARLAELNGASDRLHFVHGLLAEGGEPRSFVERPYMSSSLAELNPEEGKHYQVSVIREADLLAQFPPPYDLIKLDIEGAELEFFRAYPQLLKSARHIVVEWHHWPGGGVDAAGLERLLTQHQFHLVTEVVAGHPVGAADSGATCGVLLFENRNFAPAA